MSLDHPISRRNIMKATGGLAAASALGVGATLAGAVPAHAAGLEVVKHENYGRMEFYEVSTPSIAWNPRINVLLPDGYDSGKHYPVLYLFHGGGGVFTDYDLHHNIRGLTAGRDLIVVMPDGGIAGWHCNPVSSNAGARNWETFHIEELIPWVDATFRTFPEAAGRAVSGFSMGGFGALKYTAKYYGHFASVSAHSGPADLRAHKGIVTNWANVTSSAAELAGGYVYGEPWDEARVSADNPMERIESYRNKRIFLVAGTDRISIINLPKDFASAIGSITEQAVLETQRGFAAALDSAGIQYERHEEPGGHLLRPERLQQDIDGVVAHLRTAG